MRLQKLMFCELIIGATTILSAAQITLGQNAILNPGAETGIGSSGGIVAVPDWTVTGQFTAVTYAAGGGFPLATDLGPTDRGNNFFAGGPSAALSTGVQTVDVSNIASDINAGLISFALSGYLGGFSSQADNAVLTATFLNSGSSLGAASIGPVTASDRGSATGLLFRTASGLIPVGTTSIQFSLILTRLEGAYDDGYADNLSFVATAGAASTPEPSTLVLFSSGLAVFGVQLRQARRSRRTQ